MEATLHISLPPTFLYQFALYKMTALSDIKCCSFHLTMHSRSLGTWGRLEWCIYIPFKLEHSKSKPTHRNHKYWWHLWGSESFCIQHSIYLSRFKVLILKHNCALQISAGHLCGSRSFLSFFPVVYVEAHFNL